MYSKRETRASNLRGVLIDAGIAKCFGKNWRNVMKIASYKYIGRDAKFLNTTMKMNNESFDGIIDLMVEQSNH